MANWEDLGWDTNLQETLKRHERVIWDSRTGLFSYKVRPASAPGCPESRGLTALRSRP